LAFGAIETEEMPIRAGNSPRNAPVKKWKNDRITL
jgi:hypothetical protein